MKTLDSSSSCGRWVEEMREWGLLAAPASGIKYPVIKSFQYALLVSLISTIGYLPALCVGHSFGSGDFEVFFNVIFGFAVVTGCIILFDYWVSATILFCNLANRGHLAKLSPKSVEVFQSRYQRKFHVQTDPETCMERVIGALQSNKYARLVRLDRAEGIVEVVFASGVFKMRELKLSVSPSTDGASVVRMASSPIGWLDQYCAMGGSWLLDFCELEDQIKTGNYEHIKNPYFFKVPKLLLPAGIPRLAALNMVLLSAMVLCVQVSGPSCDDLMKQSQASQFAGDFAMATEQADAAVQKALASPQDEGWLAPAYMNQAHIAILQVPEASTLDSHGSVHGTSLSRLKLAESVLKKAMALDNKCVPLAQLACIEALKGNNSESEKLMAQSNRLYAENGGPEAGCDILLQESLYRGARGLFYHIHHDDMAAVSGLENNDGRESIDMIDAKFALGLWSKMAAKNPHLHDAFIAHRDSYRDLESTYSFYHEPSDGIFNSIAAYLAIFALYPAILACLLKDGYRLGPMKPFEELENECESKKSSVNSYSEIEKHLDEEKFWQDYMDSARTSQSLVTETSSEPARSEAETADEDSGCVLKIRRTAITN